nr:F0F1 ATP synthase subunit beta [Actinomycetota bacterium]
MSQAATTTTDASDGDRGRDGRILAVIGPVIDVEFPPESMPEINHALRLDVDVLGEQRTLTAEVAQHIGDRVVRAIVMQPTDGVSRGTAVRNTGAAISVPVGPGILGHLYNVLGEPLDCDPDEISAEAHWPIHRDPPLFEDLEPQARMFET